MPNHCANKLTVTGTIELAEFRALARDGDEAFSIGKFIVMPSEIADIHCGSITVDGERYTEWRGGTSLLPIEGAAEPLVPIGRNERERLIAKYGAANSIDWACRHWGTKWGSYQSQLLEDLPAKLVYQYMTAWQPLAESALKRISRRFAGLKFEMKYAECGSGFCGVTTFADGKVKGHNDWRADQNKAAEYEALLEISG